MPNRMRTTLEPDRTGPPQQADSAAPAQEADAGQVLRLFGMALAAERASRWRYAQHSDAASRALAPDVAVELLQHADEKHLHVQQLAQRIQKLGGEVERDPAPSDARPAPGPIGRAELADLIREDIVAEYVLIDTYAEMRRRLCDSDPISGGILEDLLAIGEVQSTRLIRLLRDLEPARRPRREDSILGTPAARADRQLRAESR
jgi:bacterioferritin